MQIVKETGRIPYFSQGEAGDVKTIVDAESVTMTKGFMDPGQGLKMHNHPNEQMGYVLAGEGELTVGDKKYIVKPGDTYYIPPNEWHAWANTGIERFYYLDVFSPRREDLESGKFDFDKWLKHEQD